MEYEVQTHKLKVPGVGHLLHQENALGALGCSKIFTNEVSKTIQTKPVFVSSLYVMRYDINLMWVAKVLSVKVYLLTFLPNCLQQYGSIGPKEHRSTYKAVHRLILMNSTELSSPASQSLVSNI